MECKSSIDTPQSFSIYSEKFEGLLKCPVKKDYLSRSVLLIPCGHTISEAAAEILYPNRNQADGIDRVEHDTSPRCPLCQRKVVALNPNVLVRQFVSEILDIKLDGFLENIPFPGTRGEFVLEAGDWSVHDTGTPLVRQLVFLSQRGASFQKMSILGYEDGSVAISIRFDPQIKDYLVHCGLQFGFAHEVYKSNPSDIKLLFTILTKHNEIPEDKLGLIQDLVTTVNWKVENSERVRHKSNFFKSLECPVTLEFVEDAVLLIPCGHTISLYAANGLCEVASDEDGIEKTTNQPLCPHCRDKIVALNPNLLVREIVSKGLEVPVTTQMDDKEDTIPFPGTAGKFALSRGDWSFKETKADLVRDLWFSNESREASFQEMEILGYRNGSVRIIIHFDPQITNYLLHCGFILEGKYFYKSNSRTTKLLFKILAKYNEIPEDKFSLIQTLVESGDWRTVTPL